MNLEYDINGMLIIAIVGLCIKIFFGNITSKDGSYGRANSTIWGYGVVTLSILTVLFINFAIQGKINNVNQSGLFTFLKSFLSSSGPGLFVLLTLIWIISLNVSFHDRINKGRVAKEYYQLSAGTSFLFVFQIITLFQLLKGTIENNGKNDSKLQASQTRLSFATYFISSINLIVVGMMTIILEFFSTDG